MTTLTDFRIGMANHGWNSEIKSITRFDENGSNPTYVGHEVKFSRYVRAVRDREEFSITTNSVENSLPLLEKLANQAIIISEEGTFVNKQKLTSIEELTQAEQRTPVITSQHTAQEVAEEMLCAGWGYSESITASRNKEEPSRHFSFARWGWHGNRTPQIGLWHLASASADWDSHVLRLANIALEAWDDFTDSVPMFEVRTGKMVEDPIRTRYFQKS